MKRKLLCMSLIIVLIASLLAGCGNGDNAPSEDGKGGKSEGDKVMIVRATGDPMTFNPDTIPDDYAYPIVQNIFNRLVKLDASKQIIPDLATDWDVSEDGKTITFNLRDDAKWHDGEKVTSKDVKYTFDTIKENESYYMSSRLAIVDSIETPDEYTVVFNMNRPDVSFIADLGWYGTFILPEHIFNNGQSWEDNPASKEPIGSGPFKFEDFKQGESITLVANPDYHEGAPKLDKIIFSIIPDDATAVEALLNGDIDVLDSVPAANVKELEANENIRLALNEYPSPMRIIFNLNEEILQDVNVRRAIATAIDREEISQKIFDGIQKPEYNMYPSLIEWVSNSEQTAPKFNIEEAINILEEAGYTKDADGYYIRGLTIDVFEDGGYPDAAKLMEATLAQAGIELIVQVHEFNAWSEKVDIQRDFMLELQGGFMGPDPAALQKRLGTGEYSNYGDYSNKEFDELLEKGAATGNQDERAKYYKKAQAILAEELPYIPIVAYAGYDANNDRFINLPIDGEGKWGWSEYTFTDIK
ncbi:ABC transporter substrate-binding protein [Clostridium sp. Cult3]|uniref:ABC transporter substrate-binding protein n=1 Tax=Clostridium sp. Cult3 TaxID=2079004 RepID=UPI001F2A3980|nr:ABC transporter substrate-binding protein [Clostridium sp. Cult3]MCF6460639.1 peptide ABC transporter substrate-binding protein [Clostridium sp. Cult3]